MDNTDKIKVGDKVRRRTADIGAGVYEVLGVRDKELWLWRVHDRGTFVDQAPNYTKTQTEMWGYTYDNSSGARNSTLTYWYDSPNEAAGLAAIECLHRDQSGKITQIDPREAGLTNPPPLH